MSRSIWKLLFRYRLLLVTALGFGSIATQPTLLAPLGRAYVIFCKRFLAGVSFGHHYPPLLVAFLALIAVALTTGLLIAIGRQLTGQQRLDSALATRPWKPTCEICQLLVELDADNRITVTDDSGIYAFCGGLIRPRIYLSRGLLQILDMGEIEAVIRHELHHVSRRDPLRFFIFGLARNLSSLFPILATLDDRVRIRAELAADHTILTTTGIETLAGALVKIGHSSTTVPQQASVALLSPTNARVNALIGRPVSIPFRWRDIIHSVIVLAGVVALAIWLSMQGLPSPPACTACPPF